MRFYALLNFQNLMMALFSTAIFIIVFGIALGYKHFYTKDAEKRKNQIIYKYPAGIEDRNAPFPIFMLLIIVGAVIWAFFYILMHGLLGVKI
jgi:ABC-type methionine transport system permease subunit